MSNLTHGSRSPNEGLKLTYTSGSLCDDGRRRTTQFLFECSPTAGRGVPSGVFGNCDYMVTWETAAACPIIRTPIVSAAFWLLIVSITYLSLGFAYNVHAAGGIHSAGGWNALPHAAALRATGRALHIAGAAMAIGVWKALERCTPFAERMWRAVAAWSGRGSNYSEF